MRVFAQGKGPGPYNVGIEFDDGSRTVVTYRTFKYKYKEKLVSDAQYVTALGFVQFDPQEREANGKTVTEFVIKTPGGDGKNIRVTIWPETDLGEVAVGDFIAVDGKFTSSSYQSQDGSPKTSLQISATYVAKLGTSAPREDREVVVAKGGKKAPF
jgi:hypothetical protein